MGGISGNKDEMLGKILAEEREAFNKEAEKYAAQIAKEFANKIINAENQATDSAVKNRKKNTQKLNESAREYGNEIKNAQEYINRKLSEIDSSLKSKNKSENDIPFTKYPAMKDIGKHLKDEKQKMQNAVNDYVNDIKEINDNLHGRLQAVQNANKNQKSYDIFYNNLIGAVDTEKIDKESNKLIEHLKKQGKNIEKEQANLKLIQQRAYAQNLKDNAISAIKSTPKVNTGTKSNISLLQAQSDYLFASESIKVLDQKLIDSGLEHIVNNMKNYSEDLKVVQSDIESTMQQILNPRFLQKSFFANQSQLKGLRTYLSDELTNSINNNVPIALDPDKLKEFGYSVDSVVTNAKQETQELTEEQKDYNKYLTETLKITEAFRKKRDRFQADPTKGINASNGKSAQENRLQYVGEYANALRHEPNMYGENGAYKNAYEVYQKYVKELHLEDFVDQILKVPVKVELEPEVIDNQKQQKQSLVDNTGMSYKEKLAQVKELISLHKNLARYSELEDKDDMEGLDEKEEAEFFKLQEKIIEADSIINDFRESYKGLKLELKNGSEIIVTADSLDQLANVKPGNIKDITLEYTEFTSALTHLENSVEAFDGGLVSSLGSDASHGYWGELIDNIKNLTDPITTLQNELKLTEKEATDLYQKIQYLDENLFDPYGGINLVKSKETIPVLDEVATLIQNKYKESAQEVLNAFKKAENISEKSGRQLSDYFDGMDFKRYANNVVNNPLTLEGMHEDYKRDAEVINQEISQLISHANTIKDGYAAADSPIAVLIEKWITDAVDRIKEGKSVLQDEMNNLDTFIQDETSKLARAQLESQYKQNISAMFGNVKKNQPKNMQTILSQILDGTITSIDEAMAKTVSSTDGLKYRLDDVLSRLTSIQATYENIDESNVKGRKSEWLSGQIESTKSYLTLLDELEKANNVIAIPEGEGTLNASKDHNRDLIASLRESLQQKQDQMISALNAINLEQEKIEHENKYGLERFKTEVLNVEGYDKGRDSDLVRYWSFQLQQLEVTVDQALGHIQESISERIRKINNELAQANFDEYLSEINPDDFKNVNVNTLLDTGNDLSKKVGLGEISFEDAKAQIEGLKNAGNTAQQEIVDGTVKTKNIVEQAFDSMKQFADSYNLKYEEQKDSIEEVCDLILKLRHLGRKEPAYLDLVNDADLDEVDDIYKLANKVAKKMPKSNQGIKDFVNSAMSGKEEITPQEMAQVISMFDNEYEKTTQGIFDGISSEISKQKLLKLSQMTGEIKSEWHNVVNYLKDNIKPQIKDIMYSLVETLSLEDPRVWKERIDEQLAYNFLGNGYSDFRFIKGDDDTYNSVASMQEFFAHNDKTDADSVKFLDVGDIATAEQLEAKISSLTDRYRELNEQTDAAYMRYIDAQYGDNSDISLDEAYEQWQLLKKQTEEISNQAGAYHRLLGIVKDIVKQSQEKSNVETQNSKKVEEKQEKQKTKPQQEAQSSTATADTVVKNEERKQKAYTTTEEKLKHLLAETLRHGKNAQDIYNAYKDEQSSAEWQAYRYNLHSAQDKNRNARTHLRKMLGLNDPPISAVQGGLLPAEFDENDIVAKFGTIENAAKELAQALSQGLNIHDFIQNYQSVTQQSETVSNTVVENEKQQQQAYSETESKAKELAKQIAKLYNIRTDTKAFQNIEAEMQSFLDNLKIDPNAVNPIDGLIEAMLSSTHSLRKILGTEIVDEFVNMAREISGDIILEDGMESAVYGAFNSTFTDVKKMFPNATFSKNGTISIHELLQRFNSKFGTSIEDNGVGSDILSKIVETMQRSQISVRDNAERLLRGNGFVADVNNIIDAFRNMNTAEESSATTFQQEEQKKQKAMEQTAQKAEETAERVKNANENVNSNANGQLPKEKIFEGDVEGKPGKPAIRGNTSNHDVFNDIDISNAKVLRQVGMLDFGEEATVTYQTAYGQIATLVQTLDSAGNIITTDVLAITTNFQNLENQVKSTFKSIVEDKAKLEKNLRQYGNRYDATALNQRIVKNENMLQALFAQSQIYANQPEYAAQYNQFINEYTRIIDEITNNQDVKNANDSTKGVISLLSAYKNLSKTYKEYLLLQEKEKASTATDEQIERLKQLTRERKRYQDVVGNSTATTEKERYAQKDYNALLSKENQLRQEMSEHEKRVFTAIQGSNIKLSNFQTSNIKDFGVVFNNAKTQIDSLNNKLKSGTITLEKYGSQVNQILDNLSNTKVVLDPNVTNIQQEMTRYMKSLNNGNVEVGHFNNQTKTLTGTFVDNSNIAHELVLTYDELTRSLRLVEKGSHKTKNGFISFFDSLKGQFSKLRNQFASIFSLYKIFSWMRQGFSVVTELDTALTEMRKVSDETIISLRQFQSVSFDVAHNIGTTATQIQDSAADFMRLGYSLKTAAELAEDANIYANVGDMGIDEATEHMVSSIQAWKSEFNNEVEASEAIINRYNEIGNNFAITSADIGSAMERSAAALKEGGNTLNESLGLITAGNIIQQDADTTANALKILSLRIRGSKTALEEMGESTDDLASSSSKLREEIKALSGVDIMFDDNTYKSTAEIITEIGKVYNNLSDVSQAALLEKLAGKNRASVVAGLLENYKIIEDVIDSAENADDSAYKENLRYLDSINGKVSQLKNEVQEFWSMLINSESAKTFIDVATQIVDAVGKITEALGGLGTAVTLGTAYFTAKASKHGGRIKNLENKVEEFVLVEL